MDSTDDLPKVINDPIHGQIELPPLCVSIIDTPQFQRLRYICQLGGVSFVFPGGTHTRFEHSIGVCHLAGQLVNNLRVEQPELGIDDEDVLCVQIAGLCHDLGHGPFSHLFDKGFMAGVQKKWKHESGSIDMFDYLIENKEHVKKKLKPEDINFIKALIHSSPEDGNREFEKTGRDYSKDFLYEIVANKRNGIDVDKLDYFARDAYHVGVTSNVDHRRLMKFCRALKDDHGVRQLCWRDKEIANLYDLFYTRSCLHRQVYQHKTTCATQFMITDALLASNDCLISKPAGGFVKISDAVDDMSVFVKLTDHIYQQILYLTDEEVKEKPGLKKARDILRRIQKRDLYKVVGEHKLHGDEKENYFEQKIYEEFKPKLPDIQKDDIAIQIVTLDYGDKNRDPIKKVRFYHKPERNQESKAVELDPYEVLNFMPDQFIHRVLRVFGKKTDKETLKVMSECFDAWKKKQLESIERQHEEKIKALKKENIKYVDHKFLRDGALILYF